MPKSRTPRNRRTTEQLLEAAIALDQRRQQQIQHQVDSINRLLTERNMLRLSLQKVVDAFNYDPETLSRVCDEALEVLHTIELPAAVAGEKENENG